MVYYNLSRIWTTKNPESRMWTPKQNDGLLLPTVVMLFSVHLKFWGRVCCVPFDESFQKISGKGTLDPVDHCWSLAFHSISTMHFIHFHLTGKLQTQVCDFSRRAPIVASFKVTSKNLRGGGAFGKNGRLEARIVKLSKLPMFLSNCGMLGRVKDLVHHSSPVLLGPCLSHWIIVGCVSF